MPGLALPSTSSLLIALVFSSIGLGYFIYGKKQKHKVVLLSGVALMVYPYFLTDPAVMTGTGVLLLLLPRFVHL